MVLSSASASWHSTACMVKCLRTSLNCASRFLCGWSVGLDFPARVLAGSGHWWEQFQMIIEDVSICSVPYWCIQRIRGFTTMCYIYLYFTLLYFTYFTWVVCHFSDHVGLRDMPQPWLLAALDRSLWHKQLGHCICWTKLGFSCCQFSCKIEVS